MLEQLRDPAHIAALAVIIGAIVRLLKSGALRDHIPARYRPRIAFALGLLGAGLEGLAAGVPWPQAFANGLLAATAAIAGHELLIESARNGRELGED